MYYVEDMAMFAWRDLDPDYQTTGHSDVTDPWISKTGESPRQWALRTAARLLASAIVGVEFRLLHSNCDAEACKADPLCIGRPLTRGTRALYTQVVGRLKTSEGGLAISLAAERGPNTDEDDTTEVMSYAMMLKVIERMYRSVFQNMHDTASTLIGTVAMNEDDGAVGWREIVHACSLVSRAVRDEAAAAGVPLE